MWVCETVSKPSFYSKKCHWKFPMITMKYDSSLKYSKILPICKAFIAFSVLTLLLSRFLLFQVIHWIFFLSLPYGPQFSTVKELQSMELFQPLRMRIKIIPAQSVVPVGKGVVIPSSGDCLEAFSEMAIIVLGMRWVIQHTCIAYQCPKGYSH